MKDFESDNIQISVSIVGTLRVVYLNGQNGLFPVGTLKSPIGTFTVRDAWLETLENGDYEGIFEVIDLSLYTYRYYGELRTAIRAYIGSYTLNDYDTDGEPEFASESLDEEQPELPPTTINTEVAADLQSKVKDEYDDGDSAGNVERLMNFYSSDSCWQLGDEYVIDSTIGRENICRCKESLLALGYEFNPLTQRWYYERNGEAA